MTWTLPKVQTLALPIDALALLILRDYKEGDGWNWQNWMRVAEQQGTAADREIGRALAEGWSWLMTHGLVVRDPSQHSSDAYVVSRLGDETLRYGIGKLAAAERLGMALHPRISQLVEQQFLLGEYDVAVFVAMREVEIRVRSLGGATDSDLGTKLMDKAFAPGIPGTLVYHKAEAGEQQAMLNLFKGAIGVFKNPTSHRAVEYEDPAVASDAVLLADLLLRILDGVEARLVL
ncbi:TIGR02391 family protein [Amycolatopsis sp. WGS_07]|uniref:TIGR02391 family protein n=1 Tax=Amycolatopsis sp. WGS_07 TaxID=3076764 RepID=UPI0038738B1A